MPNTTIETVDKLAGRRGASVLLEVLRSEGVRYVFGNPGTTELPLMDALLETPDIRYIWALQEASVVAMADGYAHAARRPGFINLHTAGGLGHGIGNLFNASVSARLWWSRRASRTPGTPSPILFCSATWSGWPAQ